MFRKILFSLLFVCFYSSYGQVNEVHWECFDVAMDKLPSTFYEEQYNTYLFCAEKDKKVNISANFLGLGNLKKTDIYSVENIDYNPYPFTGTEIPIRFTDQASPLFAIPFSFCFFEKSFDQISVHSNGIISFGKQPGAMSDPGTAILLPSTNNNLTNSIVYYKHTHWSNVPTPSTGKGSINYAIVGDYPCRKLVINFFEMPSYGLTPADCALIPADRQTFQIVLYETTNIIDIHVERHDGCPLEPNRGGSTIGINNATGTDSYTVPGMNAEVFDLDKKSFRFKPAGGKSYDIDWYVNGRAAGKDVSSIDVKIEDDSDVSVECVLTAISCEKKVKAIGQILLKPEVKKDKFDLDRVVICDKNQNFMDLTEYGQIVLDAQENPENFEVTYYKTEDDVINEKNKLDNFKNFPINEGSQYVYIHIIGNKAGCTQYFKMEIIKVPVEVLPKTDINQCTSYTFPILNNDEFYLKMERLDEDGKVVTGMMGVPVENQQIKEYGYYRVYVKKTNEYSCEDVKSYLVLVENCNYPKGISPNFDGDNDYLDLVYRNIIELKIYNRYGKVVYEHGKGYKREWIGQDNNGKPLPAGTYFLYVKTQNYEHSDWIQLVREVK